MVRLVIPPPELLVPEEVPVVLVLVLVTVVVVVGECVELAGVGDTTVVTGTRLVASDVMVTWPATRPRIPRPATAAAREE